jgi:acetylornithine deacetylase/succinyl-diaminopimelate desuccinylase-like protein
VKFRCISIVAFLLLSGIAASVENFKYDPVRREIVQARLEKYKGNNQHREATLKLLAEAGFDNQHLSEMPVKESKLPNVICVLPGSSDKVIIVGAHYDRVPDGDGVVDNWSRRITFAFSIPRTKSRAAQAYLYFCRIHR